MNRYLCRMEADELIEYFNANRNSLPQQVDLGNGTNIADVQGFLTSHINVVTNISEPLQVRDVYLLRMQRLYGKLNQ